MRRKKTFEPAYPPLTRRIERTVRFEEVDALSYMWHGRYASWFEDGRENIGRHFGISYLDFYSHGVFVPLKTFFVTYHAPLIYAQKYIIETSLLWNEACILEYNYIIFDSDKTIMTYAETTQLMITKEKELLLELPKFYQNFCELWKAGKVDENSDCHTHSSL